MSREEGEVFPLVSAAFAVEDWVEAEQRVPPVQDPLFGEHVEAQYQGLYERLLD